MAGTGGADLLISAERAQCPFLSWSLHYDRGWPVVRIEASADRPDDIAPIAAMVHAESGEQVVER